MARVTVEDCVQVVQNRYELVLLAAQRARDIAAGAQMTVDRDNDKNPVVALREIADQTINLEEVRRHIISGVNRMGDMNVEDDLLLALAGQGMDDMMTTNATSVAIEEVVFDGGAALESGDAELGEDFDGIAGEDADFSAGGDADGAGDFGGDGQFQD